MKKLYIDMTVNVKTKTANKIKRKIEKLAVRYAKKGFIKLRIDEYENIGNTNFMFEMPKAVTKR